MRTIQNPEVFRENVRAKLDALLPDTTMTKNLEKGIYNYCIQEATARQIVKKWDNIYFTHLYLDKLRSVFCNLKRTEIVELDAFKRGCGATLADGGAVLGGNAVHFDRVEFVQAFVLQQRQSRNIVKRIA